MSTKLKFNENQLFDCLAKDLGLSESWWCEIEPLLPTNLTRMEILQQCLIDSTVTNPLLLFFKRFVILQYDKIMTVKYLEYGDIGDDIGRIAVNGIVRKSLELDCNNLREIFVLLECLLFKLVHISFKNQSLNYRQRTETYEVRLKNIFDAGFINTKEYQIGTDIYKTRCEFAHSIRSVNELSYKNIALKDRWSDRICSKKRKFKTYFLEDLFVFSNALLDKFYTIQSYQIDSKKFQNNLINEINLLK